MKKSSCICKKNARFTPYIIYKNESVFKAYEGTIIGKCTSCGLLKTFPAKENTSFDPLCTKADLYEKKSRSFSKLFSPIVKGVKKYSPGKKILDVGCSTGILLSLLKNKKMDVFGIEPNKFAFHISRRKFGKRVHYGTLASFVKTRTPLFDCVIYNHVFEHIPSLGNEFRLINKVIRPGGILVVGVPNTSNFIFWIRRKFWESLLPNEHVWHFNTTYLKNYLDSQGYDIQDISFNDDARQDYPFLKQIYFRILSLANRIAHTGEAVLIIAKKRR